LTGIKRNKQILRLKDGRIVTNFTVTKGRSLTETGGRAVRPDGSEFLPGFQMRYVYFLDPTARDRLTVSVLPFGAIAEAGAGMYKGKTVLRVKHSGDASGDHPGDGGSIPTHTLQPPWENKTKSTNPE
jgi:hypothetical protein